MSKWQQYKFVDKTGHCLDDFVENETNGSGYNARVADLLLDKTVEVGDMLAFRDDFVDAGFTWGIDFCFKKEGAGK